MGTRHPEYCRLCRLEVKAGKRRCCSAPAGIETHDLEGGEEDWEISYLGCSWREPEAAESMTPHEAPDPTATRPSGRKSKGGLTKTFTGFALGRDPDEDD